MKNNLKISLLLFIMLGACQTKYQEGNFSGGVQALPITSDTYRISANGNGYTSNSTIQDYVLLKAAETTLARGATHFGVVGSQSTTRVQTQQTASTANVIGGTLFITPGVNYDVVKPGQDTLIQIFTVPEGVEPPMGTMSAAEVFQSINPRVERPKSKT